MGIRLRHRCSASCRAVKFQCRRSLCRALSGLSPSRGAPPRPVHVSHQRPLRAVGFYHLWHYQRGPRVSAFLSPHRRCLCQRPPPEHRLAPTTASTRAPGLVLHGVTPFSTTGGSTSPVCGVPPTTRATALACAGAAHGRQREGDAVRATAGCNILRMHVDKPPTHFMQTVALKRNMSGSWATAEQSWDAG